MLQRVSRFWYGRSHDRTQRTPRPSPERVPRPARPAARSRAREIVAYRNKTKPVKSHFGEVRRSGFSKPSDTPWAGTKMSTQAQRHANKRNAQLSTGPRTEDGRARSSR